MTKTITKKELEELARKLNSKFRVIAPYEDVEKTGPNRFSFRELADSNAIHFNYPVTILPPKRYLLPPKDILFRFNDEKTSPEEPEKTMIFGLTFEDLEGISYLDRIFSEPYEDEVYENRRKKTLLVAVDQFSPPGHIAFDIYLQEVGKEKYAAFAGSKEGSRILKNPLFKNQDIKVPEKERKTDPLITDPMLPRAIDKSKNHPVWEELSEICFGCGICSYACPLCYCFETEDVIEIGTEKGMRCRNWSSCFSLDFAKTNAKNFREERKDRIYNWYFHKFVRMPREHNFPGCVNCNRCIVYCPAKINFRKVLTRVLTDYKKKGGK